MDKPVKTRDRIIAAAATVLQARGYSGLSTREVAAAAGEQLSQIHYHFGSKQGLVLALFEHQNARLLDRQNALLTDDTLAISEQWVRACDYLEQDIASGYVRILMELWAAGWSDPEIAKVVREAVQGWQALIGAVARRAEARFGTLGPFDAKDIAALVGAAFIGAEAFILLDFEEEGLPVRRSLRRVGEAIALLEKQSK